MTSSDKACRAIRAATKETEVLAAVRDYLESMDASAAAGLPAEILAMSLVPAEELVQTALQALHGAMASANERVKAGVLSEATLVFSAAARKLASLAKDAA
jgi:hypothetical protein